jgi:hypothetical protein
MSISAELKLKRLIDGYQVSQAIHVAASLGIADSFDEGPLTSAELAKMTGSHPGAPSLPLAFSTKMTRGGSR